MLKIILNTADRGAPSSLAASQNGPFHYIQTRWSLILHVSVLSTDNSIIPLLLKSSLLGESWCFSSRFISLSHSLFLSSPATVLRIILFAFSYAIITSWQETSYQLEASYLRQQLSNCCSRTANPPFTSISTSLCCFNNFLGYSKIIYDLMSVIYFVFSIVHLEFINNVQKQKSQ